MSTLTPVVTTPEAAEAALVSVLQTSLYPGAAPESIWMVLDYCKAAGLDPLQKPVHIVPMWDKKSGCNRDVVMPGINLYRTQAMRTGECGGTSDPVFGPTITANIGGQEVTYPEWCKVAIKRVLKGGLVAEFSAHEFWLENYATKGGKERSIAPNAMWAKRPFGQLAKCAEAQALRKAFPELASGYTAEEMEGKSYFDSAPVSTAPIITDQAKTAGATPVVATHLLEAAEAAANKGLEAYQAFWQATTPEDRKSLKAEHPRLKDIATAKDKASSATTSTTFAAIMSGMLAAKTMDDFYTAASRIDEITDHSQAAMLNAAFEKVRATLSSQEVAA